MARTSTRASRQTGVRARRASATRKRADVPVVAKPSRKPVAKPAAVPVEPTLYRFCKSGWAVLVEQQPSQQGTRFVCPFCTRSHRVTGPVRGFRKVRRAQWIKMRRVDE